MEVLGGGHYGFPFIQHQGLVCSLAAALCKLFNLHLALKGPRLKGTWSCSCTLAQACQAVCGVPVPLAAPARAGSPEGTNTFPFGC